VPAGHRTKDANCLRRPSLQIQRKLRCGRVALRYQRTEAASNTKPQWASQRFLSDLPVASRMYELSEFTKFVRGLPADTPIVQLPQAVGVSMKQPTGSSHGGAT